MPDVAAANNGYKLVDVDVSLLKAAPPCTLAVVTAVTNPLPLTVITGTAVAEPNEPVLEFTVASVALVIAVPVLPDRVKSPPVTDIEPEIVEGTSEVIEEPAAMIEETTPEPEATEPEL